MGWISAASEKEGRRIRVIGGLIAATAIENGLTLVTRNTRDVSTTGATIHDAWQ